MQKTIIIIMIFNVAIWSQVYDDEVTKYENNIFLEVFGNAGAYSVNYDRIIVKDFSIRASFMALKSDDDFVTAFPVLINYRFNLNENFLEVGIGQTLFTLPDDFKLLGLIEEKGPLITGAISYRIQANSGINFRISFTPFFYDKRFIPFGGFSFGYSF